MNDAPSGGSTGDPRHDIGDVATTLVEAMQRAELTCAIGGSLALGVWGVTRETRDVDVNVFVGPGGYEALLDVLTRVGCAFDREMAMGQALGKDTIAVRHGPWRVDLFVPTYPFHDVAAKRVRTVIFRGRATPFLDAETLALFKLWFHEPKHFRDLERLVAVPWLKFDADWVRAQLVECPGEGERTLREWDRIWQEHGHGRR